MEWYYAKNGKQEGPVDLATMQALLQSGQVAATDLAWREGMGEWTEAGKISELTGGAQAAPEAVPGAEQPQVPGAAAPMAGGLPAGSPIPGQLVPGQPIPGAPPPNSGLAITSLVLGIVSIVVCVCWISGLFGIPAVITGHMAMKQIKNSLTPIGGVGMAKAGLITGYVGIGLQVISIIYFIVMAASGGMQQTYP